MNWKKIFAAVCIQVCALFIFYALLFLAYLVLTLV